MLENPFYEFCTYDLFKEAENTQIGPICEKVFHSIVPKRSLSIWMIHTFSETNIRWAAV